MNFFVDFSQNFISIKKILIQNNAIINSCNTRKFFVLHTYDTYKHTHTSDPIHTFYIWDNLKTIFLQFVEQSINKEFKKKKKWKQTHIERKIHKTYDKLFTMDIKYVKFTWIKYL